MILSGGVLGILQVSPLASPDACPRRPVVGYARLWRVAWRRSKLDLLEPVLPALLPGKISRYHFFKVFPAQKVFETPAGGHVTDNQDPLTVPPKRQIGKKTAHPLCCLTPTLAAGVGQVEVLAPITMNLRSGCTVQLVRSRTP